MAGEITAADLDYFERTLEALALECKITDEHMFNMLAIHGACLAAAVDKERSRAAGVAIAAVAECKSFHASEIAHRIEARILAKTE